MSDNPIKVKTKAVAGPQFQAIGFDEIRRRIGKMFPQLPENQRWDLSYTLISTIPPPVALADFLRPAVSQLQGIFDFVRENRPHADVREQWNGLRDQLFQTIGYFETLRDRMYRERDCKGAKMITNPVDGTNTCSKCKATFSAKTSSHGRSWSPKAHSRTAAGQKRSGCGAFVYLATEILKHHKLTRRDAFEIARRVVNTFWPDRKTPYEDEIQLSWAWSEGKAAFKSNGFISPEDFLHRAGWMNNLAQILVWVPAKAGP